MRSFPSDFTVVHAFVYDARWLGTSPRGCGTPCCIGFGRYSLDARWRLSSLVRSRSDEA